MKLRKQQFVQEVLPNVFKNMQLLQIEISELEVEFINYLKNQLNES